MSRCSNLKICCTGFIAALMSYFTDRLNSWTARVTYREDTNCNTAVFPLLHKSLQDRARRESNDGEANGARSTTMSSFRQVYKATSIQSLNFFPPTFWNLLAYIPRQLGLAYVIEWKCIGRCPEATLFPLIREVTFSHTHRALEKVTRLIFFFNISLSLLLYV